ncbi:MAG: tRNA pseudouridine(55) synthase TruB [Rehaibacterium terrae]|uniref:tRNA pseudouridine(55) synthase TruB n=1 Tax=Rehaibacterium terrae TaxID=1341696 RepID=UPI00391B57D3
MTHRQRTVFRDLDGILLLDKPRGISSNQALQRARHLLRAAKAGHTGSLDPLATGLLPICFGEATKLAGHLLGSRKAYLAVARLGVTTDTEDAEGQVLRERPVPAFDDAAIEHALTRLRGRIRQRPPVYSALKQGGEPLYAKARRGEQVTVGEREVEVFRLELLGRDGDRLRLEVECGPGTYIRSLVRDLGEALGCGAHILELRRLWVDPFRQPAMTTLDRLEALDEAGREALLLPVEAGLGDWRRIELEPEQARRLGQGQTLRLAEGATPGPVAVFGRAGRVLGLGEIGLDGCLRPQRLFRWAAEAAKPGVAD